MAPAGPADARAKVAELPPRGGHGSKCRDDLGSSATHPRRDRSLARTGRGSQKHLSQLLHDWAADSQQKLSLSSGGWKPEIEAPADPWRVRTWWFPVGVSSPCPHHREGKGSPLGPLIRAQMPFTRAPSSPQQVTSSPPKDPTP